jgi:hypothetical protein
VIILPCAALIGTDDTGFPSTVRPPEITIHVSGIDGSFVNRYQLCWIILQDLVPELRTTKRISLSGYFGELSKLVEGAQLEAGTNVTYSFVCNAITIEIPTQGSQGDLNALKLEFLL